MTYDQWKTTDPRDYEPEECEHAFFEIDWNGRAHCDSCLHGWWASADEIEAQRSHEAEYAQWVADQERWTYRLREWLRGRWFRIRFRWETRHWAKLSDDDEIPF